MAAIDLTLSPEVVPTVSVPRGGRRVWDMQLFGRDQEALDLTSAQVIGAACLDGTEIFPDGHQPNDLTIAIRLIVRDPLNDQLPLIDITGELLDTNPGHVRFLLSPDETAVAGTFEGQVGLFADAQLMETWPVLVEISENLFAAESSSPRLSINWIRQSLKDLQPSEFGLRDTTEFSDQQVMNAVRRAVDRYNLVPPYSISAKVEDFPSREMLLVGTQAYLFESEAAALNRDFVSMSGARTRTDEQQRAQIYLQIAAQKLQEFEQWAYALKSALDSDNGWAVF